MLKKLLSVFLCLILFSATFTVGGGTFAKALSANAYISYSDSSPCIGDEVVLTLTIRGSRIYSAEYSINYDSEILRFENADCATNSYSGYLSSYTSLNGESQVSYHFTFTTISDGICNITISGSIYDLDETLPFSLSTSLTVITTETTFSGSCGDNLIWSLNTDTGELIISGTGKMSNYSGTSYNGANVTTAPWGEYCNTIKTVVINTGVTSIGDYAFYYCTELTSVTIPDSVTSIGIYAFRRCTGLTNISFGNSVTDIGAVAFSGCTALTSIIIPDSVTSISMGAFRYCTELTDVNYTGTEAQWDVIMIESYNNPLIDATKHFNYSAITIIDSGSCGNNLVWEFDSNGTLTISGTGAIGNYWSELYNDTYVTVAPWRQYYQTMKTVVINTGVTSIGDGAFRGCAGLTNVTISDSVTYVGWGAFNGCTGLTSITIGNRVTTIAQFAFRDCTGLTSIIIPNSITSIIEGAFINCSGLTSITVDAGNTVYHSAGNCLIETASKTLIVGCNNSVIPTDGSITSIGSAAFYGCTGLTNISIPDSVTSIGEDVFYGCTGLTNITIADSVTFIGNYAFYGCTRLTSIIIPERITSIGYEVFRGCTGLTNVTIPNSVTSIEYEMFFGCTGLTSIIIPNAVTSIGGYAFYGCTGMTSITIPDSVTSIGNSAFYNCSKLGTVHYTGTSSQRANISIGSSNTALTNAVWHDCTFEKHPPTCTTDGYTAYSCNDCEYTETIISLATGHHYTSIVTELTCTERGYTTYTCTDCGDSYVDNYTSALGHTLGIWQTRTAATCTQNGLEYRVCSVCGAEETRVISHGEHHYIAVVTDPTCTESGYTTYACEHCGDSYISDRVNAVGHNYVADVTSPTCTDQGYTTHTCADCGDSYIDSYTSALGHSFGAWQVRTAATCTQNGLEYRVCSVCGGEETRVISHGEHHYIAVVTNPTCTESGYTTYTCEHCGDSYISDRVNAKGHHYTAVVTEPTCTSSGYTTHTCTDCGDSYIDNYTSTLGHTFGAWQTRTAVTCIENGEEYRVCSVCGQEETRVILALGHDYSESGTDPTCTQDGYTTYTCERCGNCYFSDYVAMTGHHFEMISDTATCTEEGTLSYQCSNCGDSYTTVSAPHGHDYSNGWIVDQEASYTTEGHRHHCCTICGTVADEEIIPVLLHTGNCTDTITWSYNEATKTLVIFGEGALPTYSTSYTAEPWYLFKGKVKTLIVEEGITDLGTNTFSRLTALKTVVLPTTVETIGKNVFKACKNLDEINLNAVREIDSTAFTGCPLLQIS